MNAPIPAHDRQDLDRVVEAIVALAEHMPHLVGIADDTGRLRWVNDAGLGFLGSDGTVELTTADLFAGEIVDRYYASIRPALARDGVWSGELPVKRVDGSTGVVDAVLVAAGERTADVGWIACLAVDVTEQHRREASLSHRASHDPLTGLPNRALLDDHLSMAVSVAERTGSPVGVLIMDLDGFKDVNDRFGHAVGDQLLQQVSTRVQAAVRPADTVARLGGDEFVVVLHPPEEPSGAMAVAERVREQIALVDYVIGDHRVHVTASIGFTLSEAGASVLPEVLLRTADRGMYRAKRAGGNCVRFAGSDDPGVVHPVDRMGDELGRSIAEGRISAAFEPVVDLASGDLCALQVGIGWEHPTQGWIPGADFAEEAEVTGYADLVWWSATRRALRAASDAGVEVPLHLALSTMQLRDVDLAGRLRALQWMARGLTLHLKVDALSLLELATVGGALIDTFTTEGSCVVLAGHGERNLPSAILAALPLSAVELDPSLVADATQRGRAIALATQVVSALEVPCIAPTERPEDVPVLAGLGVTAVRGPAVGAAWAADRLAGELAAWATRPRPSPSR